VSETLAQRIARLLNLYDVFWGIESPETLSERDKECRNVWLVNSLKDERERLTGVPK
jgi:hypothetical protein